jgi:hypothetical protein
MLTNIEIIQECEKAKEIIENINKQNKEIIDNLKKAGGGTIARHDIDTYEKLQYRQDEDNANWYYGNQK